MIEIRNDIEARALGRALAWVDVCELRGTTWFTRPQVEFPVVYNKVKQQYKAASYYPAYAKLGNQFLIDFNGEHFFFDQVQIAPWMADNRWHNVQVIYVLDDRMRPERLSKTNLPKQYVYFHSEQIRHGIIPSDSRYIHPLDRVPKDTMIARLLNNEGYDEGEYKSIITEFRDIESGQHRYERAI